jgi:hypothetical protein
MRSKKDSGIELSNQISCLQKSVANLRNDLPDIIERRMMQVILHILKDYNKPRAHIEVGYQ